MAVKPVAISLLPYMWSAWWRKLKQQGVWHGANTSSVMAVAIVGFFLILAGSIAAFKSLQSGATSQGMIILEMCLNSAMMGWLIIPVMVGSTTAEGRGVQPTRMGQFPLGSGQLLAVGLLSRLVQPVYWILTATSLVAMLPLLASTQPVVSLIAGALFIIFSAMLAWSIELFGSALFSSRRGREAMMLGLLLISIPIFFLVLGDFSMPDGALTFTFRDHSWLLLNAEADEGLFARARVASPAVWVSGIVDGSAVGLGFLMLTLAAGFSSALAHFSLRRVMLHPPGSMRQKKGAGKAIGTLPGLPVVVGTMVIKELRYLTRTLDHLMGVGMGLIALGWLIFRPEHLVFVLPLGAMNIVFNESAIPLNTFGLDGPGADRYRLLPMSGRQVMLTKNLAYFAVVAMHVLPLFVGGFIAGGAMLTLCTMLGTATVCLGTAVGGNRASVNSPAPRAFFNFDSKEQTGGGLALFLAALVWLIPTGVFFALFWVGLWVAALGLLGLLVGAVFFYRGSLAGAGEVFDRSAENMRGRLSGE